jgi:hypothetical protein
MSSDDVERARAVLAAATPGPWREEFPASYGWIISGPEIVPSPDDARDTELIHDVAREACPDDARAIILARATLPALLDVLEAANRRRRTECSDHAVPLAWCEACGAESSARRLLATAINDAEAQLREALR